MRRATRNKPRGVFVNPVDERIARKYDKHRKAFALSMDPLQPRRSESERMKVLRTLREIKQILGFWADETEERILPWLSDRVITSRDEQFFIDNVEYIEKSEMDDYGEIEDLKRREQRATNRIRVVTWYGNQIDHHFMMAKTIVSPIPDPDQWGARPLSRSHWHYIIDEMIYIHVFWAWVQAVREHFDDPTYNYGGLMGWWMEPAKRLPYEDNKNPCTAQVILRPVVNGFLK